MQEGDVQIKGYPVRLALDVLLCFTANPEDYTARGKIITPLKDRIGSEIDHALSGDRRARHGDHGAGSVDGARDAAGSRSATSSPKSIERVAFEARTDKRIDRRSGVSQRMPISVLENVVSNAERRALQLGEREIVPRISDIYAALPAITGKIELEYEGELVGGTVDREASSFAARPTRRSASVPAA